MANEKKENLTKLHLYFIFIGGLLMVASTALNYGYVDWLLGTVAIAIFFPTILTDRFTKKIVKGTPSHKKHGLIGALLSAVLGGIFTGIPNYFFMPFKYGRRDILLTFLFTGVGVIAGAIVGFLITYLPKKKEFEQIS